MPDTSDTRSARARGRQGKRAVPDWAPAFIRALGETHMVTEAAKRAGIHRDTAYDRRGKDEGFAREWAEIEERSTEELEREAYRRAHQGTERPVFQGGILVGAVREFSDTLMIFLLKARRPDVYREQHRVEHVGRDGTALSVELNLDAEAREAIAGVLRRRPAHR